MALARRPRLPAATQSLVIRHSSFVISQQWLAVAQGQWFPGRPPSLRSGGWGVALWRAAAVLLPSRVRFPPQLVGTFHSLPVVVPASRVRWFFASGLPSFCFPLFYYATFTWLCQEDAA
ncbi:hypothetical protein [Scytonema sp. HK-05]|uniref:hypothetical protein n=1 Tax=Scytonema sp. HK-05 TaxID=1137095 RepID=UPI001161470E|nr:hypothetical protein [Scytonema sp. HK-05]